MRTLTLTLLFLLSLGASSMTLASKTMPVNTDTVKNFCNNYKEKPGVHKDIDQVCKKVKIKGEGSAEIKPGDKAPGCNINDC